nr:hypothetical protein [Streptomyces sp. MH191]
MHHHQQDVLIRRHPQQPRPQGYLRRQIKGTHRQPRDSPLHTRALHNGHRQLERLGRRKNPLPGNTRIGGEDRPQHLVAAHHVGQRRTQRLHLQHTGQPHSHRNVVGRRRPLQLPQEPQPLLGERQGHALRALAPHERAPSCRGRRQPAHQNGRGGRLEDRADGHLGPEDRTDTAHQPGRQQRMTAELEEVVVHADRGQTQHLGEHRAQHLLLDRRRSPAVAGRPVLRGWQGRAVELAVHRQRQRVEGRQGRGHHVLRQHGAEVGAQGHGVDAAGVAGGGHDVGDQSTVTGAVLAHHHRRPCDGGVGGQRGLDLAQLDPETTDLHLVVGPPEVLQLPVRVPAGQITRAVHPLTRTAVRVRHEPLRRQSRPVQIAARELGTGEVQLTGDPRRYRPQPRVQDEDSRVRCGPADGDAARRVRLPGAEGEGDAPDGRLGGAVLVGHEDVRVRGPPPGELLPREVLPADDEVSPFERPGGLLGQQAEVTRGHLEEGGRRPGGKSFPEVRDAQCAAREQGAVQGGDGQVEGGRGVQHRPPAQAGVGAEGPAQVVGDRRVAHHDALGASGGAGGVDDVGGVVGQEGRSPLLLREVARALGGQDVHGLGRVGHEACHALVHRVGEGPVGDQQLDPGVPQHVSDAVGGVGRVDGHVGGPGLDHREECDDEIGGAVHEHRHACLRPGSPVHEGAGEPVGARVHLGVGQPAVVVDERGRVRGACDLRLDEVDQRGGRRRGGGVLARPRQEPLPLAGLQDVDPGDGHRRVGDHRPKDEDEAPHDGLGARVVEQVRGVGERSGQTGRRAVLGGPLGDLEVQVELGGQGARGQRLDVQSGQVEPGRCGVLEGEHDLEQRVAGHRPGGGEVLHQPLEGHVLVGVGGEVRLAGPGQQLREGRGAGQVRAQDEGVDEEADQIVQCLVGAAGDRGAEGDVLAGPEPVQQDGQCRLQHHEHRHALRPGQLRHGGVEAGVDGQSDGAAPVGGERGARPVERQSQFLRQVGQCRAPVVELPGQHAVRVALLAEQLPLPLAVVGVLHRQRCPCGGATGLAGRVGGRQVACERGQGPSVARDVVHDEHQDVLLGPRLQEPGPQRDLAREVEAVVRGLGEGGVEIGHAPDGEGHRGLVQGEDALVRLPGHRGEHGPQHLVPLDQVTQGVLQGVDVQRSGQAQGEGDVVGRRGPLQLPQEPQPLLREGERCPLRPPGPHQRPPPLAGGGEPVREGGRGGRLEDRPEGHLGPEDRADAAHQPGRQQRVTAQLEEVVVHADGGQPQDVGEHGAEEFLLDRCRSPAAPGRLMRWSGQGLAVELAVHGQRQRVEDHERRGHHVLGKHALHVAAYRGDLHALRTTHRDQVADETPVAGAVLAHHHRRLRDAGVRGKRRLDLAQLDPETTDLHLVVGTAEVFDLTVRVPAGQITRAVHPLTRTAVRARHEPLRRHPRTAQIPPGKPRPRKIQLPRHAHRNRPQRGVQDMDTGVPDRCSDGDTAASGVALAGPGGDLDRGLGGPVEVVQRQAGEHVPELSDDLAGERLAAAEHGAQRGAGGRGGFAEEDLQQGGDEVGDRDALASDQFGEVCGVAVARGLGDHDPGAVQERPEELTYRHVEAEGCLLQHPVCGAELIGALHPGQPVDDSRVRYGHALGPSGGAGGVDDVGGMGRPQRSPALGVGGVGVLEVPEYGERLGGVDREVGRVRFAQAGGQVRAGEHQQGPGVLEDVGDAFGGVVRVHGHVGAARLEHREEGDDQVDGTVQHDCDRCLGAGAPVDQQPGEAVGARVQVRVRHLGALVDHREGVRGAGGPGPQQLREGRRRYLAGGVVPLLQDEALLGVAHQRDPVDAFVRPGPRQPVQHVEELRGVRAHGPGVVQLGIALGDHGHAAVGRPVVHRYRQVVEIDAAE